MGKKRISAAMPLAWDAALFFALYIILPEYFALELPGSLPLLTASRALLMLMGILVLVRRRELFFRPGSWTPEKLHLGLTGDKLLCAGMLAYFVLITVSNLALLPREAGESIKAIFVVAAEEYVLVWLLSHVLDSREKIVAAMRLMVLASGVVAVLAIVGAVAGFNLFHLLDTVEREMLMVDYYRLGMLRAAAGFGHPVYYGAYCIVLMPVNMYFVEHGRSRRERNFYGVVLALNMAGMVLSNSRGSLLAFGALAGLLFFVYLARKRLKQLFGLYLPVIALAMVMLVLAASLSPGGMGFLTGIADSVVDVVNPGETTPETPPEEAPQEPELEYGENENGLASRLAQFTGIRWTLEQRPLFGFGSNAHVRGEISYQLHKGVWTTVHSIDVGIVGMVCQNGLVGLLAYVCLFGAMLVTVLSRKYRREPLMLYLGLAFAAYQLCLLSVSSLNRTAWSVMALIVCLVNVCRREQAAQ